MSTIASAISPVTGTLTTSGTGVGASVLPSKVLNQDDFLKLLVAQFTSQDPLKPQADTAFIAQMAQFSALEQSKSMQADIAKLTAAQSVGRAQGMVGSAVTVLDNNGNTISGTVSSVKFVDGSPKLVVNGLDYDLSQVQSLSPQESTMQSDLSQLRSQLPAATNALQAEVSRLRTEEQLSQANSMIGRAVAVQAADGTAVTGSVSAVQLVAGTPKIIVNGQAYDLSQVLAVSAAQ